MTVQLKNIPFDPRRESHTSPCIWIADTIEVASGSWVKIPTASEDTIKFGSTLTDRLADWGRWFVRSYILKDDNHSDYAGVMTGGMQAYLSFFPESGQTVWLKSLEQFEYSEYDGVLEVLRDGDGQPIPTAPATTPTTNDPFRFVGTTDRDRPFIVGPFSRSTSVWAYSNQDINFAWVTFVGSNAGLSIAAY